jgi:FkbM family methyltransferase
MILHNLFRTHLRYIVNSFCKKDKFASWTCNGDKQLLSEKIRLLAADTDQTSYETILNLLLRYTLASSSDFASFKHANEMNLDYLFPNYIAEQQHQTRLTNDFVLKYRLPENVVVLEHISNHFGMIYFPPEAIKSLVGRDVIDGGGCSGDSAMVFSEYNPKSIHVFEANPQTFPMLKDIIAQNADVLGKEKDKIIPVPLALGREAGKLVLGTTGALDGSASVSAKNAKYQHEVDVVSIDEYAKQHSLNVGLIKLDVEGAESDVVDGALETIKRDKPLLIISIYHNANDFFEIKPKLEKLNLGYRFIVRHLVSPLQGAMSYCEFCLIGYVE